MATSLGSNAIVVTRVHTIMILTYYTRAYEVGVGVGVGAGGEGILFSASP